MLTFSSCAVVGAVSLALTIRAIWFALHYSSAGPFWDFWNWLADYKTYTEGGYHVADLIKPHNEHRILTTRLVLFVDAILFHMTGKFVAVCNFALLVGTGLILGSLARPIGATTRSTQACIGLLYVAAMTSTVQWQNLVLPFQIQYSFLCITVVGAAISIVAIREKSRKLVGQDLLAILAAGCYGLGLFSMAAGLLALPWLLLQLCLARTPLRTVAVFIVFAAAPTIAFLIKYDPPRQSPLTFPVSLHLAAGLIKFTAAFLGSPLYPFGALPVYLGLLGIILFSCYLGSVVSRVVARHRSIDSKLLGLVTICGTLLLAAGAAAVSRYSEGIGEAAAPRYVTVALLFWITILTLSLHQCQTSTPSWQAWFSRLEPLFLTGALVPLLFLNFGGRYVADARHFSGILKSQTQSMVQNVYVSGLFSQVFYGDRDEAKERMAFLKLHHLGAFAAAAFTPEPDISSRTPLSQCRGGVDLVYRLDDSRFVLRMWLGAAQTALTADWIVLLDRARGLRIFLKATEYRGKVREGHHTFNSSYGVYSGISVDKMPTDRAAVFEAIGVFSGKPDLNCVYPLHLALSPVQVSSPTDFPFGPPSSSIVDMPHGVFRLNGAPTAAGLAAPWSGESFYGSGVGGDKEVGLLDFNLDVTPPRLALPIAVGPDPTGQSVSITFHDNTREQIAVPHDTKEARWRVLVFPEAMLQLHGGGLRIEAQDTGAEWGQWMAVAAPTIPLQEPRSAALY